MECPTQNSLTDLVVESFEVDVSIVVAASLPTENGNALEYAIGQDGQCRRPPNGRVSKKVNLSMVFAPEVDTTSQDWPRARS